MTIGRGSVTDAEVSPLVDTRRHGVRMLARCGLLALVFAIGLSGQDSSALYRQGVDLQHSGDLAGAAEAYRKSLAIDASNVAALSNLGAALAGLGRYDEAISEYLKAIDRAPDQFRPVLRQNLALAYYKSGRLREAAPMMVGLHEAEPASHEAALLAADCLLQLGEPAEALKILEPFRRVSPPPTRPAGRSASPT